MNELFLLAPLELRGLLVAVFCGFIVGFERQWYGKPAGIRTSILICLSAYIFVRLGQYYQPDIGSIRIVGQIVTGVGFLGAGVIIAKEGLVQGVTSAAVIWIIAAMGSLIGLGNYISALWVSVATLLILLGITALEQVSRRLKRGVHRE